MRHAKCAISPELRVFGRFAPQSFVKMRTVLVFFCCIRYNWCIQRIQVGNMHSQFNEAAPRGKPQGTDLVMFLHHKRRGIKLNRD